MIILGLRVIYVISKLTAGYEKQSGVSATKVVGKIITDVFPNIERVWIEKFGKVAQTGESTSFEDYNQTTNRYYHAYAFCFAEKQVGVIFKDITRKRKTEEALKESEKKYKNLFNNATTGFALCQMIFDKNRLPTDFRYLDINGAFERISGLGRQVVLGKTAEELFPLVGKQNPGIMEMYGRVATAGMPEKVELCFKPLNIWLEISASSTEKGYFVATFNDITERKNSEEALKESEQLYHTVFDNSQDGFQLIEIIYDENGKPIDHKFLKVNHAYEKIIGVKAEDILDKTAKYISPNNEPHWVEVPDRVLKTGKSEHVELYNKDINKTLDCYYFKYSKNIVGTLFRDVTERKNLEKTLQDKERLAAIGATAGMVGHDIRNPLQAITGDVFLAKSEVSFSAR